MTLHGRQRIKAVIRLLLTVLLLAALPTTAFANAGPPWRSGDRVGELNGLESLIILREHLTIDLRPLSEGKPAIVEANYEIYNKGDSVNPELWFVAGSPIGDRVELQLDNKDLPFSRRPNPSLPAAWKLPPTTPGIGGGDLPYHLRGTMETALAFVLPIEAGKHTLRVRYEAEASAHASKGPTRCWQLAYILAPARAWGGFGNIDVTVHLPPGWDAASDPELKREGDRLFGTFNGVPADAIGLTVQCPPRMPAALSTTLAIVCWSIGVVGGIVLCWRMGTTRGRHLAALERSSAGAWPISLLAGILWAILLAGAVVLAMWLASLAAPAHQETINPGYGRAVLGLLGLLIAALALPVGLALSQIAAYRVCCRSTVLMR